MSSSSSEEKAAIVFGGCFSIMIIHAIMSLFWGFMFYLVYDLLLPVWIDGMPEIDFLTYVVAGIAIATVQKIFK